MVMVWTFLGSFAPTAAAGGAGGPAARRPGPRGNGQDPAAPAQPGMRRLVRPIIVARVEGIDPRSAAPLLLISFVCFLALQPVVAAVLARNPMRVELLGC